MGFLSKVVARVTGRSAGAAIDPARTALEAFSALQNGDGAGAARLLAPALAVAHPHADVLFVQGLVHQRRAEHATAARYFRKAVEVRPALGAAWSELGAALTECGDVANALGALERAAALEPRAAGILQNLGRMRFRARDLGGSIAALDAALALQPDLAEAHFNLAEALLAAGDFHRGWAEYEWRPELAKLDDLPLPRWEATAQGRVAVVAEQGLGDVILAARLLPRLKRRASRVTAFVQPQLVRLIARGDLADQVRPLAELASVGPADYEGYLPFMSIAQAIGLKPGEIDRGSYLAAAGADRDAWRERLGPRDGPLRVGLVWAGNPAHDLDYDRSIAVSRLAPLSQVQGVALYSLQVPASSAAAALPMIDLTRDLADLADTAALVQTLDLVIAVDTAVAHLAGALGAPVWVLCPYRADWRWEIGGRASPWYASARIFRPCATAEWEPVIEEVAAALTALRASGTRLRSP